MPYFLFALAVDVDLGTQEARTSIDLGLPHVLPLLLSGCPSDQDTSK